MLKVLIDQDFDHDILRGIVRRIPLLDFVTAFELGLSETLDPELLKQASLQKRILLTQDRKTMPRHVADLINSGEKISGVIIVPRQMSIGQAIDELEIMILCSEPPEWENIVKQLPL